MLAVDQLTQKTAEESPSACCCFPDSRKVLALILPRSFYGLKYSQCSTEIKSLCVERCKVGSSKLQLVTTSKKANNSKIKQNPNKQTHTTSFKISPPQSETKLFKRDKTIPSHVYLPVLVKTELWKTRQNNTQLTYTGTYQLDWTNILANSKFHTQTLNTNSKGFISVNENPQWPLLDEFCY